MLEDSGTDISIDVKNSSEVQNEKQKNLHNPNRPKFFKFGEAIFRYQSNDSKSEMLPTLPSPIDKFIRDLKIRKLYPSDEKNSDWSIIVYSLGYLYKRIIFKINVDLKCSQARIIKNI